MKGRSGFTLIELLVVIAIIAILAAILFPVFISAKEQGKQVTCLSNTRQFGSAMVQYLQDNHEKFPLLCYWPIWFKAGTQESDLWYWQLYRYMKSEKVRRCPAEPRILMDPGGGWGAGGIYRSAYGLNGDLVFTQQLEGTTEFAISTTSSKIMFPTKTVCFIENSFNGYYIGSYTYRRYNGDKAIIGGAAYGRGDWPIGTYTFDSGGVKRNRHNGGRIVAFCDGHASWVSGPNLYGLTWGLDGKY